MAVPGHADPVPIDDAGCDRFVDGSGRVVDQLFQVRIIGSFRVADDRKLGIFNQCIARKQKKLMARKRAEHLLGAGDLTGGIFRRKVVRIGVENRGKLRS